jgi:DNA-binding transcriptional ArsR family regulator
MEQGKLPHQHPHTHKAEKLTGQLARLGDFVVVSEVFKQLADPSRARIFWLLCHCEECVINIAALVDMSSPAVSHHLRQLKDSGLITARREGKEVYYKVSDTEVCQLLHRSVEQMMSVTCPR